MGKINFVITSIMLIIFYCNSIQAFSVASSYWEGNPVKMYPGETKTIDVRLQNFDQEDDKVTAEIIRGEEIASLEQTEFIVKSGTKNTPVPIELKIPKQTEPNTNHLIKISFRTLTPSSEGGVSLGVAYSTSFDVLVIPKTKEVPLKEKETRSKLIWLVAVLAIISLIMIISIILILKSRKKLY